MPKKSRYLVKFFVIAAFLTLPSCSRNPYHVVSVDSDNTRAAKAINGKFIFLEKSYFENDVEVTRLVEVLNSKSLQFNLKNFAFSGREKAFLKAIDHMKKSEYEQAVVFLQLLRDEDFGCQAGLLKIDCKKELNKASPTLDNYQAIYDCCSNPEVKNIVKQRFRFHKYGL
jgi:hypothetical protein